MHKHHKSIAHAILGFTAASLLLLGCKSTPETVNYPSRCPDRGADVSTVNEADGLKPILMATAQYPVRAAREKVEGYVILEFDISDEGHTKNIEVIESSPAGYFEQVAIDALSSWQYGPTDQRRTSECLTVQLDFTLDLDAPSEASTQQPNRELSAVVAAKIKQAYEHYTRNDVQGAIDLLLKAETPTAYDAAYVHRFIGNLYAQQDQGQSALTHFAKAVEAQVLKCEDQLQAMLMMANLSMQAEQFQQAIEYYQAWIDYNGGDNPSVRKYLAQAKQQIAGD